MKKILALFAAVCFTLSACIPDALQPQPVASPASISDADIQATVAAQVAQTVESLPTPTLLPSSTPFVITATNIPTLTPLPSTSTNTPSLTPSPSSVTPGTVTAVSSATSVASALASTGTADPGATATGTAHYQYYGTMPPDLPSGKVVLSNMSKRDAYISMQCTTPDGYVTIIEYPVGGSRVNARIPAGNYFYVAWVGGKQFTGSFNLKKSEEVVIRMYKDRVEVK